MGGQREAEGKIETDRQEERAWRGRGRGGGEQRQEGEAGGMEEREREGFVCWLVA